MKRSTKPALKLRSVAGLLEDVNLAIPTEWVATLRAQAGKLDMPLEDLITQYCGHLAAEREALGEAVASPTLGDAVARFRLGGSFLKSFQREAHRVGLPVATLMYRSISDSASVFDGRKKEALPKPLELVAKRRKWLGR